MVRTDALLRIPIAYVDMVISPMRIGPIDPFLTEIWSMYDAKWNKNIAEPLPSFVFLGVHRNRFNGNPGLGNRPLKRNL